MSDVYEVKYCIKRYFYAYDFVWSWWWL